MTQYYSRTDTVYSGSAVISIPFSYISKDDISVIILRDDEEIAATFTWQNASQINITTELQTGDVISVRRHTPIDEKIVTYTDESMILDDNNLNLSQDQLLDAVQEIWDNGLDVTAISSEAITKADTALATANSADSKADNAVSTANTASSNASTALSNSQTALSNSQTAVSTANSASGAATYASNKVDAFGEDIAVVIAAAEEIEALEEAVTTATNAADTATNAAETATTAAQALQNIKTVNSTSLLGGGNVEVADLSLSNLNATGQAVLDNKLNRQQVTNCIIESPQRVKYTLVNGVLTILAGSIIVVPYGVTDLSSTYPVGTTFLNDNFKVYETQYQDGKFFVYVEVQEDIVSSATSAGAEGQIRFAHIDLTISSIYGNVRTSSGTSDASGTYMLHYQDTKNIVQKTDGSGNIYNTTVSLPFARIVSTSDGGSGFYTWGHILNMFNSIGYIGLALWVDKGVKVIAPNGLNSDGSLNNTEYTQASFNINTFSSIGDGQKIFRLVPSIERLSYDGITTEYYDVNTNYNRLTSDDSIATQSSFIGKFAVDSNVITNFIVNPILNINSMCDGQWIAKQLTLAASGTAVSSSDINYDLSNYLPKDGCNYEVLLGAVATTGSTSGNYVSITVTSGALSSSVYICQAYTRAAAAVASRGNAIIPINQDRVLTLSGNTSSNFSGTYGLYLGGYRRIGGNY